MTLPSNLNNKRLAIIMLEVLLVLGFIAVLFFSFKQITTKKTTQEKQATVSAKPYQNQYSLNNSITGKIVQIDKKNRSLILETLDEKKQRFTVKIPENTEISRPSPIKEGDDPYTTSYPPIVKKFEDLHIGSIVNMLSKEDPKLNSTVTAVSVEMEV